MNDSMREDYEASKVFWNTAFAMDDETKKEAENSVDKENDWKQMAASEKMFKAVQSLGTRKRVLDYGCGEGWAAIIAAKSGCKDVTGAETASNAAEMAQFYVKLFELENSVQVQHISEQWITEIPAESYDGIFCSNVLDVVPEEVAEVILGNFKRIAEKEASVIIGMNYYMEPKDNEERNIKVKGGKYVYLNGVLRMVTRTDEEWTEILSRYFTVERLVHFAWPGEDAERRRLFYLKKK